MPSWEPQPSDVRSHVEAWANAATDEALVPLTRQAAIHVVSEVGAFDPTVVINPRAAVGDRITLGELAGEVAAVRAAYKWAAGYAPEQMASGDLTTSLLAEYTDALARLKRMVEQHDQTGYGEPITGAVRLTLPSVRRGTSWG